MPKILFPIWASTSLSALWFRLLRCPFPLYRSARPPSWISPWRHGFTRLQDLLESIWGMDRGSAQYDEGQWECGRKRWLEQRYSRAGQGKRGAGGRYGHECAQRLELEHLLINAGRCESGKRRLVRCSRIRDNSQTPLRSASRASGLPHNFSIATSLSTSAKQPLSGSFNPYPVFTRHINGVYQTRHLSSTLSIHPYAISISSEWLDTFYDRLHFFSSLLFYFNPLVFLLSSVSILFSTRHLFWYPMNFLGFIPVYVLVCTPNYILLFFLGS